MTDEPGRDDRPEAWLEAARAGDTGAQHRLFGWLFERLVRHARRLMGPTALRWEEPEDIVQRILAETLDEIFDPGSRRTTRDWVAHLVRRARWRIIDLVERRGRDAGESAIPVGREQPLAPGLTQELDRRDVATRMHEAVERLPSNLGVPLRLVMLEELSYEEAGRRLGLKPDAVRKRCERARSRLNDLLGGR